MADPLAHRAFLEYHPSHICTSDFVEYYTHSHKDLVAEYTHHSRAVGKGFMMSTQQTPGKLVQESYNRGLQSVHYLHQHCLHHHPITCVINSRYVIAVNIGVLYPPPVSTRSDVSGMVCDSFGSGVLFFPFFFFFFSCWVLLFCDVLFVSS